MAWKRVRKLQANLSGFKQARYAGYLDGAFTRARAIYRKFSGVIYDGDTGIPATDDFIIMYWQRYGGVTFNTNSITMWTIFASNIEMGIVTQTKFDVTNYNYLKMRFQITNIVYGPWYNTWLGLSNNSQYWWPSIDAVAYTTGQNLGLGWHELTLDVSAITGEYYVYAGVTYCQYDVHDIWLE
jgi:hypothetical protein